MFVWQTIDSNIGLFSNIFFTALMMACFITEAHWSEVVTEIPTPFSKLEKVVMCINSASSPPSPPNLQFGLIAFNSFSI